MLIHSPRKVPLSPAFGGQVRDDTLTILARFIPGFSRGLFLANLTVIQTPTIPTLPTMLPSVVASSQCRYVPGETDPDSVETGTSQLVTTQELKSYN
jgi:hypothetical protein